MAVLLNSLAELDCLMSLATVSRSPGWVKPQIVDADEKGGLLNPLQVVRNGEEVIAYLKG